GIFKGVEDALLERTQYLLVGCPADTAERSGTQVLVGRRRPLADRYVFPRLDHHLRESLDDGRLCHVSGSETYEIRFEQYPFFSRGHRLHAAEQVDGLPHRII